MAAKLYCITDEEADGGATIVRCLGFLDDKDTSKVSPTIPGKYGGAGE